MRPHGTGALPGTTTMRWSQLPEETAWMMAHAAWPTPIAEVIDGFEREFGIRLRPTQVSLFRAEHGLQRRRFGTHPVELVPVGTERVGKDGYVIVKTRDLPTTAQSKDNWQPKQRVVWEREHGRELREDEVVMFADGDKGNFDPGNLVAVPRRLVGILNEQGHPWHDRESLEACLAEAELASAIRQRSDFSPRRCEVCGRTFTPDSKPHSGSVNLHTCRECLAAGRKAYSSKDFGTGACRVCGRPFRRVRRNSTRCPECIAAKRWRPATGRERP